MKSNIKNIVFDLGGVILYDDFRIAAKPMAKRLGIPPSLLYKAFLKVDTKGFNKGILKEKLLWERVGRELGIKPAELYKLRFIHYDIFRPMPGSLDLLKRLGRKYNLYLLSNQTSRLSYIKRKVSYSKFFIKEMYSYKVKAVKPEKRIYTLFLKRTGINPREAIFVDNQRENLVPARALGFNVILFKNPEQLSKDLFKKFGIN